jgi:hypothetical protein
LHDIVLRERSDHADRINELEKTLKSRALNMLGAFPFGRRASDKKEDGNS